VNIAFIASALPVGGVERQWQALINKIDNNKYCVTLICLYSLGEIGEEIKRSGIKSYSNVVKSRFSILSVHVLKTILEREKINICFLWNQPLTLFYGVLASKLANVKRIITAIHSTGFWPRKVSSFFLNKLFTPYLEKIVAVGTHHKDYLVRCEGFPAEKVVVIFNGVDINQYDKDVDRVKKKREIEISEEDKVVGIVSRLTNVKRHDIFLRAAKMILHHNPNVVFLIIGDGEQRYKIEGLITEQGLSHNVKMLGLRKDIVELNKILDVSVLSSDSEALPMTLLESMASSVPIVATNVGSVPDIIINGENGFLISPNSPGRLAEAVLTILNNENLAKKMGERGRQIASSKFSEENMVSNYEKLFMGVDLFEKV